MLLATTAFSAEGASFFGFAVVGMVELFNKHVYTIINWHFVVAQMVGYRRLLCRRSAQPAF